jgi:signal transduction histidine kinase
VIKNRSAGLFTFVHQYKSLINVPKPILKPTPITEMLNRVQLLIIQYLQGRGISLIILSPLQNVVIHADVHMIEQVMLNLLYNAADALQDIANPRIVIACEERADNIVITVSDNGRGIDKYIEDKIFIPFFTTKSEGTGVGLSLSKQIMHMHGGNIGVHSSPDTGTVFTLSFSK